MQEYCDKFATVVETEQSASRDPQPAYMTLVQQYGLDDMEISDSIPHSQATVKQEYQLYIMAPLSPKTVNIIKFFGGKY